METVGLEQPILRGDALPDGYAEIVKITGAGRCSGTLITNSLVLTAKRCIYAFAKPFREKAAAPLSRVYPASAHTVTYGAQVRTGSLVVWHPGALDAAMIRVDSPFAVGGSTLGWRRAIRRNPVNVGDMLECYGYGHNAIDPTTGMETGFGTLRHSSNRVSAVASTTFDISASASGQILAGGDSGGACFSGQELAGINSRSDRVNLGRLAHGPAFIAWAEQHTALFPDGNDFADGVLLRDELGHISVVIGGAPLWIGSWDEYLRDWSTRPLYQTGPLNLPKVPRDGTLLRDPSGEIDVFYAGARFPIPSMGEFYALGLSTTNLRPAPSGSFFGMPRIPRDGVALRDRATGEIDVMHGGHRYQILSMLTYYRYYRPWPVYWIPTGGLAAIPYGGAIP